MITKICGSGISAAGALATKSASQAREKAADSLQGFRVANLQKGFAYYRPDSPFPYASVRWERLHEHPEGPRVTERTQHNGALHPHLQSLQEITPFCNSIYGLMVRSRGCFPCFFKN